MSETKDPMIAALLREREGYVKFGKADRVKAVDKELKRRGHEELKAEPKKAAAKKATTREGQQEKRA